ncbi:MAG: 2Fe-2S iron-sulfur cluster-binding protein [Chloroflexota bacterium]
MSTTSQRQVTPMTTFEASPEGRLPAHPSHKVDLDSAFTFQFEGKDIPAFEGDTVASALWAVGRTMLGRSFKYHRPRGPFALTSGDSNTIMRIDDKPNARASMTLAQPDMQAKPQNVWPSLGADVMSLTSMGSAFMPVGFYYKTFIRPKSLWPLYEKVLRNAAGLGYVTQDVPDTYFDKKYDFADVLVIGGGPAGMSAALSAADSGANVILLDENPYLGGHLLHERQTVEPKPGQEMAAYELAEDLVDAVEMHPNIQVELNANAFGIYDHLWIGAEQNGTRLLKLRTKTLVVANGAFEQPLLFANSDLPGVMLGSAVQRLMHVYGVCPGKRAIILSANRDGLQAALDLHAAGVNIPAVFELRPSPDADLVDQLTENGVRVTTDYVVTRANGGNHLSSVTIAKATIPQPVTAGGVEITSDQTEDIDCDLLVVSVGWMPATGLLYQAKAKMAYNEDRGEFLPTETPENIFMAGRVAGTHGPQAELLEGKIAGLKAAAAAGFDAAVSDALETNLSSLKSAEPIRTSKLIYMPDSKKSFLSFDEDVSIQDLRDAIEEGYSSMELLKRYSTLSMGPSQGKYESINTMALAAEANQQTIAETGTTTSRPPYSPITLGALAGRIMEPVKYTPMHQWHVDNNASLMNAGLWKRPEHYGNPSGEVLASRNGVGLIDVSTLGKLKLQGKDVPKLLEMLYTNKWKKLAIGRARYGVMCNEEGIVSDDGVTAHLSDDVYYMTATSSGVSAVYENLEWNLQSGWDFDVQVSPMTDANAAMNLTGPLAREVLQPLTDIDLSNEAFPYMGVREGLVAGVPAIILRIGFTGELGYELHVPAGYGLYLWETLMEAGKTHGIRAFGVEAQRIMRLEKGHFIVGQDTDGLTDPFMAHLDWAVKLDKADFLGKPSLVRIQKKGVTQKLVGYEMLDPEVVPEEANQIVVPNSDMPIGYKIIGRITSSRFSPVLKKSIGLCWLPVKRSDPGMQFSVRIRGELHKARVVPIPFYDPDGERLKS